MTEIILGIDPGSRITGYGIVEVIDKRISYLGSGCIRMTHDDMAERLQQLFTSLREIVTRYQPQELAIEQVFFYQNPNTALKLGQARGVAIVAATLSGLSVSEYSARQIKQSVVGYGAAAKEQVQEMVRRLLQLSGCPQVDASDALAVALCHAHTRSNKLQAAITREKKRGRT
jgi:crossover junction endodeoxyribonuclease RuvC